MRAISRLGLSWNVRGQARANNGHAISCPSARQEEPRNDFWALVSGAEYDGNHKEGRQEEDRQAFDQEGRSQDDAADDEEAVGGCTPASVRLLQSCAAAVTCHDTTRKAGACAGLFYS